MSNRQQHGSSYASYHGSPHLDHRGYQQQQPQQYYSRPHSAVGGVVPAESPVRRSSMRRRQQMTRSRPQSPQPDYMETPWGPQYPSTQWGHCPNSKSEIPPPAHRAVSAGNLSFDRGDSCDDVDPPPCPQHQQPPYQRGAPVCSALPSSHQPYQNQRRSKSVERVIQDPQQCQAGYSAASYQAHFHNNRQDQQLSANTSAAWFDPYATLPRLPADQQQQQQQNYR